MADQSSVPKLVSRSGRGIIICRRRVRGLSECPSPGSGVLWVRCPPDPHKSVTLSRSQPRSPPTVTLPSPVPSTQRQRPPLPVGDNDHSH